MKKLTTPIWATALGAGAMILAATAVYSQPGPNGPANDQQPPTAQPNGQPGPGGPMGGPGRGFGGGRGGMRGGGMGLGMGPGGGRGQGQGAGPRAQMFNALDAYAVPFILEPETREAIKLTDDQAKKLQDTQYEEQKAMIDMQAKVRLAQLELSQLIDPTDKIDRDKVLAQIDVIGKLRTDSEKLRVGHLLTVRETLTADQIKQVQQMARERRAQGPANGPGNPGAPGFGGQGNGQQGGPGLGGGRRGGRGGRGFVGAQAPQNGFDGAPGGGPGFDQAFGYGPGPDFPADGPGGFPPADAPDGPPVAL